MEDYNVVVTMWDGGVPVALHFIKHIYGQPKWYIMTTSMDEYSKNEAMKCCKLLPSGRVQVVNYLGKRGRLQRMEEWQRDKEIWANTNVDVREFKFVPYLHDNLFDFYKAVGYDYKKKKYESEKK